MGTQLYITVANVLAACTISPIKDAAGNPQPPKAEMDSGWLS
jgi:hypothetical protein